jgi:hypothetical protein
LPKRKENKKENKRKENTGDPAVSPRRHSSRP